MAVKKLQKMFYYSNEYIKKFIESRIDDLAIKTQRSSSYIIENLLLDGLLPSNEEARYIIRYNLYSDDENGGVKKTLQAAFSSNSAGINWQSLHSNFKPLIEYCLKFCDATSHCTGNEPQIEHFINQLESVCDRIENCTKACIELYDRDGYEAESRLARSLLNTAREDPSEIIFAYHFQLVHDCWEMLDDWQITYRYLCDLATMCDWQENSTARNCLYDVINDISKEW